MLSKEKNYLVIFKLWQNLSKRRKLQTFFLILFMIISNITDLISISSVVPFTSVLIEPNLIINNDYYPLLQGVLGINSSENLVSKVVLLFITAAIASGVFKILYFWFNLRLSACICHDLSAKAFLNTIYQPYNTHLNWNSSKLITSIDEKTNSTVYALHSAFLMISSIFLCIFLSIFLLITHPYISILLILVFVSSYLILLKITKKRLYQNGVLLSDNIEKKLKVHQEALGAIRDVILDGSHKIYFSAHRKLDRSVRLIDAENKFISLCPRSIIECIGLVFIALLSYSLIRGNNAPVSVLPVLAVLALGVQKFLPAIQQIYGGISQLRYFNASILGVLEFVEMKIPTSQFDYSKVKPFEFNKLDLININYVYPSNKEKTLSKINLSIEKGERIGIIGPSGCGKSTLIDILLGLIEPTSGLVKINDKESLYEENGENLNIYKWRRSIAHVPQSIFLIDSDLYENIAFGINKYEIDRERVIKAAKQAQIDSFIKTLPNGYRTKIGERGVRLSGGQRQRIGIARAIYKEAKILVLDEATSSLDNNTEKKVINSINELSRDLTIFMVAHRLSTLVNCDRVINLKGGKLSAN